MIVVSCLELSSLLLSFDIIFRGSAQIILKINWKIEKNWD